jgi:ferrous iron transport protein A
VSPAAVTLAMLPAGARAVVQSLRSGREVAGRLSAMGLIAGAPVEVLQNRGSGPLLVRVRDTRIALGRGEALKIVVSAEP